MPKAVSGLRKLEVQVSSLLSKVNGLATKPARAGTGGRQGRRARNRLRDQRQAGSAAGAAGPRSSGRMGQSSAMAGSLNVSAPSSVGVVVSNSYFRMDGKAQLNTEIAGMGDSCRVVGCDLFGTAVASGASGNGGFAGSSSATLTPNQISPRLANLEELYQYYAIRQLQIQYIPTVGSNTSVSVATGVEQSYDASAAVTYNSQQKVLELTPSVLAPAWQSASMTYRHTGSKLWRTTTVGAGTAEEYVQALLECVLLGHAASTTYGQLRMEYVIDFYKPTPVESNPSLLHKTQLSRARMRADEEKLIMGVTKLCIGSKDAKDAGDVKHREFDDTKSLSGAEAAKLFADPDKIYPERFVLVKRPQSSSTTAVAPKPSSG